MDVHDLRQALGRHLGAVLTPEIAADILTRGIEGDDRSISVDQFLPQERPDGYVFKVESFRAIKAELEPLHAEHFAETERYRAHQGLHVDLDAMERDERAGRMLQFTMRCKTELVGNIRFYLGRSRHTGATFAEEDTYYVLPWHRKGLVALRFWQYAERCLRQIGVVEVRTDSKLSNNVGRLNEYLGYQAVATKYVKALEGDSDVQRRT